MAKRGKKAKIKQAKSQHERDARWYHDYLEKRSSVLPEWNKDEIQKNRNKRAEKSRLKSEKISDRDANALVNSVSVRYTSPRRNEMPTLRDLRAEAANGSLSMQECARIRDYHRYERRKPSAPTPAPFDPVWAIVLKPTLASSLYQHASLNSIKPLASPITQSPKYTTLPSFSVDAETFPATSRGFWPLISLPGASRMADTHITVLRNGETLAMPIERSPLTVLLATAATASTTKKRKEANDSEDTVSAKPVKKQKPAASGATKLSSTSKSPIPLGTAARGLPDTGIPLAHQLKPLPDFNKAAQSLNAFRRLINDGLRVKPGAPQKYTLPPEQLRHVRDWPKIRDFQLDVDKVKEYNIDRGSVRGATKNMPGFLGKQQALWRDGKPHKVWHISATWGKQKVTFYYRQPNVTYPADNPIDKQLVCPTRDDALRLGHIITDFANRVPGLDLSIWEETRVNVTGLRSFLEIAALLEYNPNLDWSKLSTRFWSTEDLPTVKLQGSFWVSGTGYVNALRNSRTARQLELPCFLTVLESQDRISVMPAYQLNLTSGNEQTIDMSKARHLPDPGRAYTQYVSTRSQPPEHPIHPDVLTIHRHLVIQCIGRVGTKEQIQTFWNQHLKDFLLDPSVIETPRQNLGPYNGHKLFASVRQTRTIGLGFQIHMYAVKFGLVLPPGRKFTGHYDSAGLVFVPRTHNRIFWAYIREQILKSIIAGEGLLNAMRAGHIACAEVESGHFTTDEAKDRHCACTNIVEQREVEHRPSTDPTSKTHELLKKQIEEDNDHWTSAFSSVRRSNMESTWGVSPQRSRYSGYGLTHPDQASVCKILPVFYRDRQLGLHVPGNVVLGTWLENLVQGSHPCGFLSFTSEAATLTKSSPVAQNRQIDYEPEQKDFYRTLHRAADNAYLIGLCFPYSVRSRLQMDMTTSKWDALCKAWKSCIFDGENLNVHTKGSLFTTRATMKDYRSEERFDGQPRKQFELPTGEDKRRILKNIAAIVAKGSRFNPDGIKLPANGDGTFWLCRPEEQFQDAGFEFQWKEARARLWTMDEECDEDHDTPETPETLLYEDYIQTLETKGKCHLFGWQFSIFAGHPQVYSWGRGLWKLNADGSRGRLIFPGDPMRTGCTVPYPTDILSQYDYRRRTIIKESWKANSARHNFPIPDNDMSLLHRSLSQISKGNALIGPMQEMSQYFQLPFPTSWHARPKSGAVLPEEEARILYDVVVPEKVDKFDEQASDEEVGDDDDDDLDMSAPIPPSLQQQALDWRAKLLKDEAQRDKVIHEPRFIVLLGLMQSCANSNDAQEFAKHESDLQQLIKGQGKGKGKEKDKGEVVGPVAPGDPGGSFSSHGIPPFFPPGEEEDYGPATEDHDMALKVQIMQALELDPDDLGSLDRSGRDVIAELVRQCNNNEAAFGANNVKFILDQSEKAMSQPELEDLRHRQQWASLRRKYVNDNGVHAKQMVQLLDLAVTKARRVYAHEPLRQRPDLMKLGGLGFSDFEIVNHRPTKEQLERYNYDGCWYNDRVLQRLMELCPFRPEVDWISVAALSTNCMARASIRDSERAINDMEMAVKIIKEISLGWPDPEQNLPIDPQWWENHQAKAEWNEPTWRDTNELLGWLDGVSFNPTAKQVIGIYSSNDHLITVCLEPGQKGGTISTFNSWPNDSNGRRPLSSYHKRLWIAFVNLYQLKPGFESWRTPWRHVEVDEVARQPNAWTCGVIAINNFRQLAQMKQPIVPPNIEKWCESSRRLDFMTLREAAINEPLPEVKKPTSSGQAPSTSSKQPPSTSSKQPPSTSTAPTEPTSSASPTTSKNKHGQPPEVNPQAPPTDTKRPRRSTGAAAPATTGELLWQRPEKRVHGQDWDNFNDENGSSFKYPDHVARSSWARQSTRELVKFFHDILSKLVRDLNEEATAEGVEIYDLEDFEEIQRKPLNAFQSLNDIFHNGPSGNLVEAADWLSNFCVENRFATKDEDLWDQFPPLIWRQPQDKDRHNMDHALNGDDYYVDDNASTYVYPDNMRNRELAWMHSAKLMKNLVQLTETYDNATGKTTDSRSPKSRAFHDIINHFRDLRELFLVHREQNLIDGADFLAQFIASKGPFNLWDKFPEADVVADGDDDDDEVFEDENMEEEEEDSDEEDDEEEEDDDEEMEEPDDEDVV
ncbi:hypothetical protein PRZ48_008266 [Zasmidium cellare]|uniref:Ubiquitin-like protease family profile domain-containing protein n=1 Tax=Zasmidium cellare TaxID=395010 RepID=A0ABR0EFL6_ZASCE|nr:hypothetical protein PRZ48_008266 [Zasmidium cellare]